MKEEDELLRKCGTKNPFTVPEGYFENFSKELMEKLPEKEISLSEPVIYIHGFTRCHGYI